MALVLRPEDVNTDTTHRDASFPDPCLECAREFEFRVYVLECGGESGRPYYYVGFEHRSDVGARVRKHFTGNGACYTKERKPKRIILVWPVRHAAAEAYVFALLLSTFPAASIDRLGGWTQTSVRPSPLCRQQFEEQRRCLRSLCFRCGGRHFASACEKPVQGVQYKCPNCDCALLISSRGQSVTVHAKGASVIEPCAAARSLPVDAAVQPPLAQMRPATAPPPPQMRTPPRRTEKPCASAVPPAKTAKTSAHVGRVVSICGRNYSALSWYLGDSNPSKAECLRVKNQCVALELEGGDMRTLVAEGYAVAPPRRPTPLLPGRERLATTWIDTGIQTDRKKTLRVRRQGDALEKSLRQCLYLVSDLERVLGSRRS